MTIAVNAFGLPAVALPVAIADDLPQSPTDRPSLPQTSVPRCRGGSASPRRSTHRSGASTGGNASLALEPSGARTAVDAAQSALCGCASGPYARTLGRPRGSRRALLRTTDPVARPGCGRSRIETIGTSPKRSCDQRQSEEESDRPTAAVTGGAVMQGHFGGCRLACEAVARTPPMAVRLRSDHDSRPTRDAPLAADLPSLS
jgi:hypothetical protein